MSDKVKNFIWNEKSYRQQILLALLLVVVATWIRFGILEQIGLHAPFITFYPAVALSALFGGFLSGITATVLSILAVTCLWLNPLDLSLWPANSIGILNIVAFFAGGMLICTISWMYNRALRRAATAETKLQTEAARLESEQRLLFFIEHAPAAIAMFDTHMHYLAVSQRWIQDFDLHGQQLIGRSHYDVFPEIPEQWKEIHRRCLNGAIEQAEEDPFVREDGRTQWLRWEVRPWRLGNGDIGGILMFSEDITEAHLIREELQSSQRHLKTILDNLPSIVGYWDRNHCNRFANSAFRDWFGIEGDKVPGKHAREVLGNDLYHLSLPYIQGVLNGVPQLYERRIPVPESDHVRHTLTHYIPDIVAGEVRGFFALITDISPIKEAEEALRAKDTLLSALLNGTTDAIYVKDMVGRYLLVNHSVEKIVGLSAEKIVGHDDTLLFPAEGAEVMERDRQIMESGHAAQVEEIVTQASGIRTIYQSIKGPILSPDGKLAGLFGISRDVTPLRQAENALRQAEALLRAMLTNFPLDFWARDLNGKLIVQSDISKVVWRDLQHSPQEQIVPDQTLKRWQHNNARALHGEIVHDEAEYLLPDGSSAILKEILTPIRDGDEILGIMGINVDVTNSRRMERDLRASVDAAQAASQAKNLFLANMSHEIRTPLNGILGMLQLLQTTEVDAEQQEYVEQALKSSRRLAGLLSDILDHSRIEAGKLTIQEHPFKLSGLKDSVIELFTLGAREKGITLSCTLDDHLPETIRGDEARIRQILFNLVGNAIKFTHRGSVNVHIQPLNRRQDNRLWILYSVCDTGIGIAEDHVQTIFQPFIQAENSYTRQYQGAGLGLSIVRKLLHLMDGTLVIDSAEGEGTCLYFSIPMKLTPQSGTPGSNATGQTVQAPATPKMHILVAEDDLVNRISLTKLLEKKGHVVTAVVNGEEAVRSITTQDFDLIFMDVQMPVLDGVQATQAIRELMSQRGKAPIPIIAMTAFAMTGDREKFLAAGMDDYVAKPVAVDELQQVLSRAARRFSS